MQARGRGADGNPPNRFEKLHVETDADAWVDNDPRPLRTVFLRDDSQSVLAANDAEGSLVRIRLESIPWLRARLRLLLCPDLSRIP